MRKLIILTLAVVCSPLLSYSQTNKMKTAHQEEWDFYFSNVDGKPGSLYVDLGLKTVAPIADKPNLAWVYVQMNNPREDGFSSQEESEMLFKIEDALVERIASVHDAVYAGRLTSDGNRELYFYLGDTAGYDKTVQNVMSAFPEYRYSPGSKEDAGWGGYLDFLYPAPPQFQSIQNRRVVHQLQQQGDILTKERDVRHWIYFKTEANREEFLAKIKDDNFTVENKTTAEPGGEYPYCLVIKRADKVDWGSVDNYVLYLCGLADETDGEYDGWETSVEKE